MQRRRQRLVATEYLGVARAEATIPPSSEFVHTPVSLTGYFLDSAAGNKDSGDEPLSDDCARSSCGLYKPSDCDQLPKYLSRHKEGRRDSTEGVEQDKVFFLC